MPNLLNPRPTLSLALVGLLHHKQELTDHSITINLIQLSCPTFSLHQEHLTSMAKTVTVRIILKKLHITKLFHSHQSLNIFHTINIVPVSEQICGSLLHTPNPPCILGSQLFGSFSLCQQFLSLSQQLFVSCFCPQPLFVDSFCPQLLFVDSFCSSVTLCRQL